MCVYSKSGRSRTRLVIFNAPKILYFAIVMFVLSQKYAFKPSL